MTLQVRVENKIRQRSKDRPKSLHLLIPAAVRDAMEFEVDDIVILDVLVEQDSKILKIYKKRE